MNTNSGDLTGRKARHIEICTEDAYDPEGGSALFEHLSQQYLDSGGAEHGNEAAEMEKLSG